MQMHYDLFSYIYSQATTYRFTYIGEGSYDKKKNNEALIFIYRDLNVHVRKLVCKISLCYLIQEWINYIVFNVNFMTLGELTNN